MVLRRPPRGCQPKPDLPPHPGLQKAAVVVEGGRAGMLRDRHADSTAPGDQQTPVTSSVRLTAPARNLALLQQTMIDASTPSMLSAVHYSCLLTGAVPNTPGLLT